MTYLNLINGVLRRLRERGETGGQSAAEQFGLANIALADAIQIDANKYPSEMTFWAV